MHRVTESCVYRGMCAQSHRVMCVQRHVCTALCVYRVMCVYVCVYRGMCAQSHRVMCVQRHVRIKPCVCMYVCVRVHRIISAHDCNVRRSHGDSFHWYGVISTQCTPQSRCVCSHGVYACTHYPVHTCESGTVYMHGVYRVMCMHIHRACIHRAF